MTDNAYTLDENLGTFHLLHPWSSLEISAQLSIGMLVLIPGGVPRRSTSLPCVPWYYESMLLLSSNQNAASLSKLKSEIVALFPTYGVIGANSELGSVLCF